MMKPIDRDKLKTALKALNMSNTSISRAIGRADNYIGNCIIDGRMSTSSIINLSTMYGIEYDQYKPETNKVIESQPEPKQEQMNLDAVMNVLEQINQKLQTKDELATTIYYAVYDAIMNSYKERFKK